MSSMKSPPRPTMDRGAGSSQRTALMILAIVGPLFVFACIAAWWKSSLSTIDRSGTAAGFFDSRYSWLRSDAANTETSPSLPPVPRGVALANSFTRESFRLDHITVSPGNDTWRLCAPNADEKEPCNSADFFVVNQRDGSSDPVVDWLLTAEPHVLDLVSAIFATKLKNSCLRRTLPCLATASQFTDEERNDLLMLDIGSNHGFYALMSAAAAPWVKVYAFEPQPHCATYIQLASEASGFTERMMVLNSLAGTPELAKAPKKAQSQQVGPFIMPPKSIKTVGVPKRTGCRGTFPSLTESEMEAVKAGYGHFPGAFDEVQVHYVDPGSIVKSNQKVLFAKIDVEGYEEEVLDALHELLSKKRIYNILIELNKPQKLRRWGKEVDITNPDVIKWCADMMQRLQDYGYTLVPQWGGYKEQATLGTSRTAIENLAAAGWTSVDIFAYIPKETRVRRRRKQREEEEAAEADVPEAEAVDEPEAEEEEEPAVKRTRKRRRGNRT